MAEAIRSAQERGWCARRDGLKREACRYTSRQLRAAWMAGWDEANRSIF